METKELTDSELKFRLQALHCIIEEGLQLGIKFQNLEEAIKAYCEPDFIQADHYGCENFAEVAELLLKEYRYLSVYPNC
jgi:hypothetical protein